MVTNRTLEERLCAGFRSLLAKTPLGAELQACDELRSGMFSLEYFVPATLAEVYPEWKHESLDGFYRVFFKKIGEWEVEFFGLCILITDQTTTPIHLQFQLHENTDAISSMIFKVGEKSAEGMVRLKWQRDAIAKRLHHLTERKELIEWVYKVGFHKPENLKNPHSPVTPLPFIR